jgi:hypothetical protein
MLGAEASAGRVAAAPASWTVTLPASGCDPELDPELEPAPEPEPEPEPDPELEVTPEPEPLAPEVDPDPPLLPVPSPLASSPGSGTVALLAHPAPAKASPGRRRRDHEALARSCMKALLIRTGQDARKDKPSAPEAQLGSSELVTACRIVCMLKLELRCRSNLALALNVPLQRGSDRLDRLNVKGARTALWRPLL